MADKLWKPMLAAKPDPAEVDAALSKLPFPALFSPKLDGIRATVQNGKLYSRSLKLIPNLEMQKLWGREELDGLDGEIIVGSPTAEDCFNRTTSVVMARNKSAEGAVFHVFDRFGLESFALRHNQAKRLCKSKQRIAIVEHVLCAAMSSLIQFEGICLDLGYEGVMRRDPDGSYKQGRSTLKEGGLVAVKRFVDAEAVILDTYEQEENTNEKKRNELGKMKRSSHKAGKVGKGTLGGFTVRPLACNCESCLRDRSANCLKQFNIGTGKGLTDAMRSYYWAERKKLVGKIIKFRYQAIGTKDAPRLPVFLGFRDGRDL